MKSSTYHINHQIRASQVRVVDDQGKQVGLMDLSQAFQLAQDQNKDVVEIAPMAKPPVVKIIEFGKFKYQEEKKAQKEKRGVKGGDTKEMRFTPFIAEADYQTRMARIKEFFEDRDKVRIVVKFAGRQMNSKQFGYNLVKKIVTNLGDSVTLDAEPKFLGRNLIATISPKTTKKASSGV